VHPVGYAKGFLLRAVLEDVDPFNASLSIVFEKIETPYLSVPAATSLSIT
jgi:hypothetical protein